MHKSSAENFKTKEKHGGQGGGPKGQCFSRESAASNTTFFGNSVSLNYGASPPYTDTHLNSHHNAFFLDECWEWLSSAVFLIEGLMEKDHSPDALVDGGVRSEEDLSESSAVLLGVLHIDPLQPVPHGT